MSDDEGAGFSIPGVALDFVAMVLGVAAWGVAREGCSGMTDPTIAICVGKFQATTDWCGSNCPSTHIPGYPQSCEGGGGGRRYQRQAGIFDLAYVHPPGACVLNNDASCVISRQPYRNDDTCAITVQESTTLRVVSFNTEYRYDVLTVNGQSYSGTTGPNGVFVSGGSYIDWVADNSITNPAWSWFICGSQSPPPPPPPPPPVEAPVSSPVAPPAPPPPPSDDDDGGGDGGGQTPPPSPPSSGGDGGGGFGAPASGGSCPSEDCKLQYDECKKEWEQNSGTKSGDELASDYIKCMCYEVADKINLVAIIKLSFWCIVIMALSVAACACSEEGPPAVFLFLLTYVRPFFKFCVVIVEFVYFFGLDKCVEDCGPHLPGNVAGLVYASLAFDILELIVDVVMCCLMCRGG